MKRLLFIFLLLPLLTKAQFTDNFSDGDFLSSPVWEGDTAKWEILNEQLHSTDSVSTSYNFYLSTPSTMATETQWEFWCRLQFNTSSTNYIDVYLISDSANLKASSFNGYFVKIGNTDDEISLYKRTGGSSVKIIDGVNGILNTSNNTMRIKVTRDVNNLWTLQRDLSGTGSTYFTEGTVTDAAFASSNFFGVLVQQSTLSFAKRHYFDDFYVGAIIGDTSAPLFSTINVTSNTTVDLVFNEFVEKSSSENPANYSVNNGIGNPTTAIRDASDSSIVQLTFSNSFQNGVTNTLTINNVEDLSGNAIVSISRNFLFFIPDTAISRDVIINELFPDPDPQVLLPTFEFVELYNRSSKVFDLAGWILSDGTSNAVLGSYPLPPGEFLIICPTANVSAFSSFGNTLGVSSFPSLNNTSDNITLKNNLGNLIDAVSYSDIWYRDAVKKDGGWTLERIDPDFPCPVSENWIASNDISGGTPGNTNSVFGILVDTIPPQLISVELLSQNSIKLIFNEPFDSLSGVNLSNYSIDNGIGNPLSASVNSPDLLEVTLIFSDFLDSTINYVVQIAGVSDCIGNTMSAVTQPLAIPQEISRHDVLITEILADPDPSFGLPAFEFIELFNASNKTLNLGDLTFSDATANITLNNRLFFSGEYIILCSSSNESLFIPFGKVMGISFPSLTNSGESLTLTDNTGEVIHYIEYSDSWYTSPLKKDGGFSLEMVDTDNPCAGKSNWRESLAAVGGTPGAINSVAATNVDDVSPALVRALWINSFTVILYFDETLEPSSISLAQYSISPGNVLVSNAIGKSPSFTEATLTINDTLSTKTIYTITVSGLTDCAGNQILVENEVKFGVPEAAVIGDVIINEVLFNPATDGVDFVELYNKSDKIIDLKELMIAETDPLAEDVIIDFSRITTVGFQLLPNSYVALTPDPEIINFQYRTPNPKGLVKVASMPNYPDDEGVVVLLDTSNLFPQSGIFDNLHYSKDWHFALLDDENGVSLERINFDRPTQDQNNWHSAATSVGYATPAYQNSQFGENLSSESSFRIEPAVLSPDGDGYQDYLNIYYQFDEPDYLTNIKIYDDQGREIKHLANNVILESKGVLTWDGIDNDGRKARIGVYILLAETLNLSGKKSKFKKTFVVAGRF